MPTDTTHPDTSQHWQNDSRWSLRMLIFGITLTLVMVGGGILFAVVRDRVVSGIDAQARVNEMMQQGVVVIQRVEQLPPLDDPFHAAWGAVLLRRVEMLPQNVTMPMLEKTNVPNADVQAVHDGQRIAIRLSWHDTTEDANVDANRFADAAAIQFPVVPGASFMMGSPQAPVQVLHWKALWQKDIDQHFQDVQDMHPNYWADLYWFAKPLGLHSETGTPYRVPHSFDDPASHQWFPAKQAQNPMSQFHRDQPVEELIATGFGSLTTQPNPVTKARGQWRNGQWAVVFIRPMLTDNTSDYQFHVSSRGQIGIAIWEGASGDVGGRKQYTDWIPMQVMP